MKEKSRKKTAKVTAVCLTGALLVMAVTGCGKKTVDYDVDGTGGSTGSNADSGSLQGKYGIPETVDTEIAVGESGLQKITIEDDEITVPDGSTMYIQKETKKSVAAENRQEVVEAVFEKDEGIYAYDYENRTKADIQSIIDDYEDNIIGDKEYNDGINVSYYEEEIKNLKEELATAPDEYPAAGDYTSEAYIGTIGDYKFMLTTPTSDDTGSSLGYYSLGLKEDMISYRPYSGATDTSTSYSCYSTSLENSDLGTSETIDAGSNMCSFTEDEARQIAEDFVAKVGGTDVSLRETSPLCFVYYSGITGETEATEIDGYQFVFEKTINGQPIASFNIYNANNLQFDNATVDIPCEGYTIEVDSNGVVSAYWTDYLEADGTAEQVELLSFDELLEQANETVPAYFTDYPTNYTKVEFNDMMLSYYLKAEDDGTLSYVPAWVLRQYEEYTDYTEETYPTQVVILDATDGSVIDLVELSKTLGAYYVFDDDSDNGEIEETSEEETGTEEETTDTDPSEDDTDSTSEDTTDEADDSTAEETTTENTEE